MAKSYLVVTALGEVLFWSSSKPIATQVFEYYCKKYPDSLFTLEEESNEDEED